ncbi:hypothetical protein K2173_000857 [Erythroxylum novogranatense]|uniref:Bromo domain-containing protein n=1 Tax=Erythroxylum novogranatense TaxID=1862640 RepID=A0AAV8S7Z9_9ROSI|nr:hypothetical protein K2173_000857 [Erythroxylum novogranatense]
MEIWKCASSSGTASSNKAPLNHPNTALVKSQFEEQQRATNHTIKTDIDVDLKEVYFLILHFLSSGPCQRTFGQFMNELLEHELLPRRYHAWFSRTGAHNGTDGNNGLSLPLNYDTLLGRYPHIEKDHLIKLLKQLLLHIASPMGGKIRALPNAADVPTLLGSGSFSLLNDNKTMHKQVKHLPVHLRWPHIQADQVHGLNLREIGGGFTKHHRAPSIRAACYAIAKPSTMVQKMQNLKKIRGHRNAVYCAIFDRSGRYVVTGSDDRLVKIWLMETAFCLASCRGHEGDITDLAVSSNNALVASASNDFVIRVWRLPDGMPISVLQGHTGAVTTIAFSPRPGSVYQLLSSSDDGTCRIWDARSSQSSPRIYVPKPLDASSVKGHAASNNGPSSSGGPPSNQILCCAYNANGTVFVTGSSDTYARVWSACKSNTEEADQPIHELDVLAGHENDVNYVQFSGCAVASRSSISDVSKEDNFPKFKNSWFCHDNIVTCSRDGSAIIWIPRSRRFHGKSGRWTKAYHLKVPPPPLPPQPPRGGPRQRILPTPRGVNMIVWSLDNRFVLAAIMDCRICVWNAVDGSLVHSLKGHSESSYVLDVHPFNPRIAMSAGYDGKTIVWDIWEGIPIRTYEIGRFKLVDGKFSPDGTSIVLSDDVGQIYLLNTGQGESQKDAKYDQFFLGDYRPLVRDSAGNVLDQETQLAPHRRSIQDPLCDSSMIPYPEPYQTMFQKRRLGALGLEWHPLSINFAIGPDIFFGQDYQMPPLEDLDRIIEPLPDFMDAIYWEPENDVMTDDTDSEYNGADDSTSEGEQGGLSDKSPSDPDCSTNDSDNEDSQNDGLRRSRRRKHKTEVELMTSSGRRVKKRNLDECNGSISRSSGAKKIKSDRKISKKKSSKVKSSRPQRLAARNAINSFSRLNGTSTDSDSDDDSENDNSNSESDMQDSYIDSSSSDRFQKNPHMEGRKQDKHISFEADKKAKPQPDNLREGQTIPGDRKRLVLKLSLRDSKKPASPVDRRLNVEKKAVFLASPSTVNHEAGVDMHSNNPESSTSTRFGLVLSRDQNIIDNSSQEKLEDHVEYFAREGNQIEGQEVNNHTLKHSVLGSLSPNDAYVREDAMSGAQWGSMFYVSGDHSQIQEDVLHNQNTARLEELGYFRRIQESSSFSSVAASSLQLKWGTSAGLSSVIHNEGNNDRYGSDNSKNGDSLEVSEVADLKLAEKAKEIPPTKSTKLRIKTKGLLADRKSSAELNLSRQTDDPYSDNVHKRDMSMKLKDDLNGFDVGKNYPSNEANHHNSGSGLSEVATDAIHIAEMKPASWEPNSSTYNFRLRAGHALPEMVNNSSNKVLSEERTSSSKATVRPRSSRNRRGSYDNDMWGSIASKVNQPLRKLSWLMLSKHEEGYRYIPQLGDEVVYLRQGHQEYIKSRGSREEGPWGVFKGYLNAVEICKVENLCYATVAGSGDSCCKIRLRFTDPSSGAFRNAFDLTLPELIDFPDFVVEKTRYDAAMSRNWTKGDECQVWWRNANGEDGSWWEGKIVSSQAKSDKFRDSPWEKYLIQYSTDPPEDHLHSPWELHDPDSAWEHPHIDFHIREKLLNSIERLEQEDKYGIQKLNEASKKLDFFNRFPVPLYPEVINSRLENNYYRSLEAVKHDVDVMMENAQSYFGRNAELSNKMKRLKDWFTKKLSKLEKGLS